MKNSESNSLSKFKRELLVQMTEQSTSSLFTLTIGFIPISVRRLYNIGDLQLRSWKNREHQDYKTDKKKPEVRKNCCFDKPSLWLKRMILEKQEHVFLLEFGLIVPAVLKCSFDIICADVVYPPGEKLCLFTHFCSNERFS